MNTELQAFVTRQNPSCRVFVFKSSDEDNRVRLKLADLEVCMFSNSCRPTPGCSICFFFCFFCLTCDYRCDLCKIPLSSELKDGGGGALFAPGGLRVTRRMRGCKIQDGICPNQNQTKIDSKGMKRRTRVKYQASSHRRKSSCF